MFDKDRRIRKSKASLKMYQRVGLLEKVERIYDIIFHDIYIVHSEELKDIFENIEELSWYSKAQVLMGYCYRYEKNVKRNDKEAVKWFAKSAEQWDPLAMHLLGICFFTGQGLPKNYEKAFILQMLAAYQNHPGAFYYLGSALYYGNGIEKNVQFAIECLEKAKDLGCAAATVFLEAIHKS